MPIDESMHLLSADQTAISTSSEEQGLGTSAPPTSDSTAVSFQTEILDQVSTRRAVTIALLLALGNMAGAVHIMRVGFILAEMDNIPRIQKGKQLF